LERKDTSDSMEEYSKYWRKKIKKKKEKLEERKELLKNLAQKCSNLLKKEFNVKKVYLVGSLTREFKIHEHSDIDLAVIGLQDKDYFKALNKLYEILPQGIDIDLITKETASESLNEFIIKDGLQI